MGTTLEKNTTPPLVSWVLNITAVEYFIWGIIDPIYGLFVYEVTQDYSIVGLIFGLRALVSLFSLLLLERYFLVFSPVQNLLLVNIFMAIFSITLFAAGFFQSTLLLVVMTIFYGIVFSLKTFSRQNILRQVIPAEGFTKTMTTHVSVKYGAWILGMITGGVIISFWGDIPLYWLFLSLSGMWIFSLFPFFAQKKEINHMLEKKIHAVHHFSLPPFQYKTIISYLLSFPTIIRYNFSLFAFSECIGRVTLLFVPIIAQSLHLSLAQIFWLTAFMVLPMACTQLFSWLIVYVNKLTLIIISIGFAIIPLWYLSTTNLPLWVGICSFIISTCLAILQPAILGISQKYTPSIKVGESAKMELFFSMLGNFIGSVGIGYTAKFFGMEVAFLITAGIAMVFLLISVGMKLTAPKKSSPSLSSAHQNERSILEHTQFHFRRHFG